jgi:hypothetical protein
MKELEKHEAEKTEIHAVTPVKSEKVKRGELRPKPGQRIFQLELSTGIITQAEFKEEKVVLVPRFCLYTNRQIGVDEKIVRDILEKPGCLYVNATRAEVADKKFHKMLNKPYKKVK